MVVLRDVVATVLLSTCALGSPLGPRSSTNNTINSHGLQTWWHNTGEINTQTPVQNGNVRQSRQYSIQVASAGNNAYFDSFVYETMPRSGNGQKLSPTNDSIGGNIDGVSIEGDVGINMAWTQFLHREDVTVKISRKSGGGVDPSQVVIRPTTTSYNVRSSGGAFYITIPSSATGHKLSVEFQDDLWEYHTGGSDGLFVQNVNPSGHNYVSSYNSTQYVVGVEPKNALLIFASPFPSSDLVPSAKDKATYMVPQGHVSGLDTISQSVVYFGPGVYWFGGNQMANLSSSVSWVYLAPGAYVKGAVHYNTAAAVVKATGHGVLSGEQYVYQANYAEGFINDKSDATSLRMWSGSLQAGQNWICQGPTISAPPFNTMDFDGEPVCQVSDYKQVGAWFWQTDGMEVYPGSTFSDIFYHIGDDGIKTYYSNVDVKRLTVWKTTNDPIIQMGWSPRNVTDVTVSDVSVIHARYPSANMVVPTALIGASPSYTNVDATNDANLNSRISNFNINNLRCEGLCPSLLRINPLENFDNFTINGASIESFPADATGIGGSEFTKFTDASGNEISLGSQSPNGIGLIIKDYYVGGEKITLAANNWQSDEAGKLNIDSSYWGHWIVE